MKSITHFFLTVMTTALVLLNLIGLVSAHPPARPETQSLAGVWRFALDRSDIGVQEQWFSHDLADRITLPGILQAQGYGDDISVDTPWVAALPRDIRWYRLPQYAAYTKLGNAKMPYLSQPVKHYLGVAWYQRDITIPATWQQKRVTLTLERAVGDDGLC